MNYKTIFIDWDGTLSKSRFWEHWRHDPKYQAEHQAIQRLLTGRNNFIEDWMHHRFSTEEAVTDISQITKIDRELIWTGLIESCRSMKLLDNAIIPKLQELRAHGLKVVLATDNMDTLNRWTLPSLGLTNSFDAVLNSFYLHAVKRDLAPDGSSKFFSGYLKNTNTAASDCLLIDDSAENQVITDIGLNFFLAATTQQLLHELNRLKITLIQSNH